MREALQTQMPQGLRAASHDRATRTAQLGLKRLNQAALGAAYCSGTAVAKST